MNMRSILKQSMRPFVKFGRGVLPLWERQRLAIKISEIGWLPGNAWLAMEVIRDLVEIDPNEYHRFLWSHHIGYAAQYENANDFGPDNLTSTRIMLFEHLMAFLPEHGINPEKDIESIFEVGCSSGFLLRHMETALFPAAKHLEGIDIDGKAIERGQSYLREKGSKIRIQCADMKDLDRIMDKKSYDLVLCAGVLIYLKEEDAAEVIRIMLKHTRKLLVMTGRANPGQDNSLLEESILRGDGTFIHNFDVMAKRYGGAIRFRRWEGGRLFNGYDVYFVFCSPAAGE